jgi:hypothetical protein
MVIIMKPNLPTLLRFNGGYVDTSGYIALQGLFTAHVTGNFVTIGSALVFRTSGVVAKLLALPVFRAVIIVTRLASFHLPRNRSALQTMLTVKLVPLILGAYLAIRLSPFVNGDAWPAILTGMTLASAMVIQKCGAPDSLGHRAADHADDGNDHSDHDRRRRCDPRSIARRKGDHSLPPAAHGGGHPHLRLWRRRRGVPVQSTGIVVPPLVALAARRSANATQARPPPRLAAPSSRPSS